MLSHWFDPEGGAAAGPGTIARALQARGHEVDVLTGYPIYPAGKVFDGYRIRPYMREEIRGTAVHRVPIYPSHDDSAPRRMANYLSYAASATVAAQVVLRHSDVVYVYSSPATVATAAVPLRALRGIPYILQIQDLWPDTVTTSGFANISSSSRLASALHLYCNAAYRNAAHIAVISPGMADILTDRGVPAEKISVVPNWAEETSFRPVPRDASLASELGFRGAFTVMYAGNHGEMQQLDVLIQAAERLRSRTDILVTLVGDGVRKSALMQRVAHLGLRNVKFVEPQPFDKMAQVLALADVQLVSLKDDPLYRVTMPSKIQANMASGQPIIAAAAGDAAAVVEEAGCGFSVQPGDPDALAASIALMADLKPAVRREMGNRARHYYELNFSEKSAGDALEKLLLDNRKQA